MKFILFSLIFLMAPGPFNLDWGIKSEKDLAPEVVNYKYWYGDITWGQLIYQGTSDLDGFTTELQLGYVEKKLCEATLILGPAGLNETNCVKRYKRMLNFLNEKYGHFLYQKEKKDPVIEELLYAGPCYPVRIGLYQVENFWLTNLFRIESALFGDGSDIFIEIKYIFLHLEEKQNNTEIKKVLERL